MVGFREGDRGRRGMGGKILWGCSLRRSRRKKNVAKREAEAEALFLVVSRVEWRNRREDSKEAQMERKRTNGGKEKLKEGRKLPSDRNS